LAVDAGGVQAASGVTAEPRSRRPGPFPPPVVSRRREPFRPSPCRHLPLPTGDVCRWPRVPQAAAAGPL